MKIETNDANGTVTFIFEGRLDAVTSEGAEAAVMETIADRGRYLYDLSSLTYISSAGLRVLLATTRAIKRREGRYVVCAPNTNIRHILDISGFATLFPMADSLEEGRQMLAYG